MQAAPLPGAQPSQPARPGGQRAPLCRWGWRVPDPHAAGGAVTGQGWGAALALVISTSPSSGRPAVPSAPAPTPGWSVLAGSPSRLRGWEGSFVFPGRQNPGSSGYMTRTGLPLPLGLSVPAPSRKPTPSGSCLVPQGQLPSKQLQKWAQLELKTQEPQKQTQRRRSSSLYVGRWPQVHSRQHRRALTHPVLQAGSRLQTPAGGASCTPAAKLLIGFRGEISTQSGSVQLPVITTHRCSTRGWPAYVTACAHPRAV